MGLFKNNTNLQEEKQFKGSELERILTQEVAIQMTSLRVTEMPILKFFNNDQGIFERLYQGHMNDAQINMIKQLYGFDMYLTVLGTHSLGAGIFVTVSQGLYRKPVEQFNANELKDIVDMMCKNDSYELGLKVMGIDPNSSDKKCLDRIIITAVSTYKNNCKDCSNKDNLKVLMHVLYNAGITVVLRK